MTISFHPHFEPYDIRHLKVDGRHELHLEQAGKADGVPVVHLHGGPGFSWSKAMRRFCDPGHYRFIGYDQRGALRSTPLGDLTDNDTEHLLQDLETIRQTLGIERWIVFGGSWGSTLALAYAERHPERVIALALWGIFLGEPWENEFNYLTLRRIMPEAWQAMTDFLEVGERGNPLAAYHRRIFDADPKVHLPAMKAWLAYAEACWNGRNVIPGMEDPDPPEPVMLAASRIAISFFVKDVFLRPGQLIEEAGKLANIPGVITHGRADFICPIENAFRLNRAWKASRYVPVDNAGHSPFEPGMATALLEAFEAFKTLR